MSESVSGKKKKNISKCHLLKILPRMQSGKLWIISLHFHQEGLTISYISRKDDQGKNEITWEMRKKISFASFPICMWARGIVCNTGQLTLCLLGKNFSRQYFEKIFFLFFPTKYALTFHANCLPRRQFAWIVKAYFLEKKNCLFVVCWISPVSGKGQINLWK